MVKNKNSKVFLLLFTGSLTAFGPIMTDVYLPAFPQMQQYFGTSVSLVQLSLTFGMLGLALGQLFLGPVSDKYGRVRPLAFSLGVFSLATVACIFSPTIYYFLFFRLVQGIFGAGCVVIARSIIVDLYSGRELSVFFSLLAGIQGIAPIAAPVLGGVMMNVTDWRGIFGILFAFGMILFFMTFVFRESHSREKRIQGSTFSALKGFIPILKNRRFMRYVLTQALAFGVFFAYIAASPFIFQSHYRLSPAQYSLCFGANAFCIMIGSVLVSFFRNEQKVLSMMTKVFLLLSVFTAAALIMELSFIVVEGMFVLLALCFGTIMPPTTSLALDLERTNSGCASAILGFFQFLFGSLVSPLVGIGNLFVTTGIIILVCSFLVYLFCPKQFKDSRSQ